MFFLLLCVVEVCAFCSYGGASAPQQLQRLHHFPSKMASQSDAAQVSTLATQAEGRGTKRRACCGDLERQALKKCTHCGTVKPLPGDHFQYCSACYKCKSYVVYCSPKCQRRHWPYHKDFCASGTAQPCLKAHRTESADNADIDMLD